ncbi:MAG TPA: hypothetical protein VFZ47_09750 [Chitinophagaceae bacterium]
MNKIVSIFKWPAIISTIVILPFVVLELINQPASHTDFPFALFVLLCFVPLVYCLILLPMLRPAPATDKKRPNVVGLFARLVILVSLGMMWIITMLDQMPCFLGVPNCD